MNVILIDGNHLAHRTYYAVGPLSTSTGKSTNCIFGFLDSFRKIFQRFKEDSFVFNVFDGKGKKRGHDLYSNYKSGREKVGNDLYEQIEDLKNILTVLDINTYCLDNVEADDVIGSLALKARRNGYKVIIISADHDFEQLISTHIRVLKPAMGQHEEVLKDVEYVVNEYGLKPHLLPDVMALTGDPSDSVPGISKMGTKTACKLIKANGNLNNILSDIKKLKFINKNEEIIDAKEILKWKVERYIDSIKRNSKILKIDCSLEFDVDFKKERRPDFNKLQEIFKQLEFEKYLKKFYVWQQAFM